MYIYRLKCRSPWPRPSTWRTMAFGGNQRGYSFNCSCLFLCFCKKGVLLKGGLHFYEIASVIATSVNLADRGVRKGANGVSTNGVTANVMFVDRGTFWVRPLTDLYLRKSARTYPFPQSVEMNCLCSVPICVDTICPQPRHQSPSLPLRQPDDGVRQVHQRQGHGRRWLRAGSPMEQEPPAPTPEV